MCSCGPPFPAANPGAPAVDFRHHAVHVAALSNAVAVAAMRAGDGVAGVQVHADTDGRSLLAGVEVDEAGDLACGEFQVHALLELADGAHGAPREHQLVAAEL